MKKRLTTLIKDENIGNHGYISTLILRLYQIYWRYINGYFGKKKYIGRPKIDQNS